MFPTDTLFRLLLSPSQPLSLCTVSRISAVCHAKMIPVSGHPFTYLATRLRLCNSLTPPLTAYCIADLVRLSLATALLYAQFVTTWLFVSKMQCFDNSLTNKCVRDSMILPDDHPVQHDHRPAKIAGRSNRDVLRLEVQQLFAVPEVYVCSFSHTLHQCLSETSCTMRSDKRCDHKCFVVEMRKRLKQAFLHLTL